MDLGAGRPPRLVLVPGGGGSGPEHWHHAWAADDDRCEWVDQRNWDGGSRDDWVGALDRQIRTSTRPAVLVAHSLGTIVVAHWAATHTGPVVAALLVAPADIEDAWVTAGSVYEPFVPIPMTPLTFPSVVVASTDDPFLALDRGEQLAQAWGSEIEVVGPHLHLGSDARLGAWSAGRAILDRLISRASF